MEHHIYLDERKSLVDAIREQSRLFDRAILTLAAGALGLSLTFIHNISPQIKEKTANFLLFSWACFGGSILSTLISFMTSQWACHKQIQIIEEDYQKEKEGKEESGERNTPRGFTIFFNIVSILLFITGVLLLVYFSFQNLPIQGGSK